MAPASGDDRSLEFTPTFAVATVCTVFVVISLIVTYGIEKLEERLERNHRTAIVLALRKMKEELMLLGFISFLLTVFQNYVASICVKTTVWDKWTPCPVSNRPAKAPAYPGRRLLSFVETFRMMDFERDPLFHGRMLAGNDVKKACGKGYEAFVSVTGLHQLHVFIFVLAVVHVVYSVLAMALASWKVNGWRVWETEALEKTHSEFSDITKQLTMARQATFVAHHTSKSWKTNFFMVWILCFFRQFGQCVTKADYNSLRFGFITKHNTGHAFNFHSYMVRSLEDEFQTIVGISRTLWCFMVLFLLFNVDGTNLYFWLSFVPVVLVLLIGMKLHHVIATLALDHAGITQGGFFAGKALRPRDDLFWFNKPTFNLFLIHFILFQNAFELATFIWFAWQFGFKSCLLTNKAYAFIRIGLGVLVQILCSYSTLPLYAIVAQMGSSYKKAIFRSHIRDKIQKWGKGAKMRVQNPDSNHGSNVYDAEEELLYGRGLESDSSHGGSRAPQTTQSRDTAHDDKNFEFHTQQSGPSVMSEGPEIALNSVSASIDLSPGGKNPHHHSFLPTSLPILSPGGTHGTSKRPYKQLSVIDLQDDNASL